MRQMLQDVQHDYHVWLDRRLKCLEIAANEVYGREALFPAFDCWAVDVDADPPHGFGKPRQKAPLVTTSVQHRPPQQSPSLKIVNVLLIPASGRSVRISSFAEDDLQTQFRIGRIFVDGVAIEAQTVAEGHVFR